MFELIDKSLLQIIDFKETEIKFFNEQIQLRHSPRRVNILEAGNVCDFEIFLQKGCVRMYSTTESGDDLTMAIFAENTWISEYDSYENLTPSKYFIETMEHCDYYILNRERKSILCDSNPKFKMFFRMILTRQIIYLQNRLYSMMVTNAKEKYLNFMKNEGNLINRIPQYIIASYLGMSAEFLSKIRKRIQSDKLNKKGLPD
ncbi:MAG: Crp/Fnr family transcriptional regulator [Saprospiraceae bacterium]|nr:Crp/Fnr family transcriptional regulator [Saprospiraceae bacterium]